MVIKLTGGSYMKDKNESIAEICALCEHAVFTQTVTDSPPLLFFLKADAFDEDSVRITCPHHREAAPDFSCRKFSFDPLKYRPKCAPKITLLDEDALLID